MACRLTAMFMACRTSRFIKGIFGSSLSGVAKYIPPNCHWCCMAGNLLVLIFMPLAMASFCKARSTSEMCASPASREARRVTPSGTQRNSSSLYSGPTLSTPSREKFDKDGRPHSQTSEGF